MVCTERLRLRLLQAGDAAPLRDITSPPGWVEDVASRPGDRTLTPWAVTLRNDGTVVGFCGFFVRPIKGITMGYAILADYRNGGLATEAAMGVMGWAEQHGIDVYASIRPPNPASVRVLTKIGVRLVDSHIDEDGRRDIYKRPSSAPPG